MADTSLAQVHRLAECGDAFADFHANTRSLRQPELEYLAKHHEVPVTALYRDADGFLSTVGCAGATFSTRYFDFAAERPDGANKSMIFVARDHVGEPVNLIAWCPRVDRIASAEGRVTLLGEQDVSATRLDEPLQIFRSPIGWLKAGRRGAVIVRKSNAWRILEGVTVLAEDVDHGLELRKVLAVPAPVVVVRAPAERLAA